MLQKINSWWQKPTVLLVITSLIMAIVAPYFFKLVHLSVAWRVGLLFIILDGAFAWWIGRHMKKTHLFWALVFIFPILFAAMVFFRFAKYDYWFTAYYLLLSIIAILKD
ncbi:hypothetical protein [Lacticaseibacillus zhaodongensis]|uniref:hypothetical protein n=1 Tax=Lacticaseibacillus zhaodongensis TaxID=2668065 RepID=UPI0012D2AB0A|nr:hypothetical protein [Lacticaseibacillus zhaodongensis]